MSKKKAVKKKTTKKATSDSKSNNSSRKRVTRAFPAATFEDALLIGLTIQEIAGPQKVRRLTLFEHLDKSPDSGPSRQLITNSSQYGITAGSYAAEFIELTEDGKIATSGEVSKGEQLQARFKLAIANIEPFNLLYEQYKGNKLPTQTVLRDYLKEQSVAEDTIAECVDTFLLNVRFLGLLKTIAGSERLISLEHALDELPTGGVVVVSADLREQKIDVGDAKAGSSVDWNKTCFFITPIGSEGSEERKHADLMLGSFIEPALSELGLEVVRADQIGNPGMIATQIMEHIKKSRLAIADMSFANPNVFYEMGLRHACRLPMVQISRKGDFLPFDVNQVRTVFIDLSDLYGLIPKIEVYRADITNQARKALDDPDSVGNPISIFYPEFYS